MFGESINLRVITTVSRNPALTPVWPWQVFKLLGTSVASLKANFGFEDSLPINVERALRQRSKESPACSLQETEGSCIWSTWKGRCRQSEGGAASREEEGAVGENPKYTPVHQTVWSPGSSIYTAAITLILGCDECDWLSASPHAHTHSVFIFGG